MRVFHHKLMTTSLKLLNWGFTERDGNPSMQGTLKGSLHEHFLCATAACVHVEFAKSDTAVSVGSVHVY